MIKVSEVTDRSWRIVTSGPVRTIVELNYKGWQVAGRSIDLMSRMTVWAGERGFEHRILAKNAEGLTFVTGLPRKPGLSEVTAKEIGSNLIVVATWGNQVLKTGATATESLPDQNLGLVIVLPAPASSSSSLPADADNILASIPLNKGTAHWYVAAAWDQERSENMEMTTAGNSTSKNVRSEMPQPVRNREQFVIYVKELSSRLATAPIVQISQKTIPRSK